MYIGNMRACIASIRQHTSAYVRACIGNEHACIGNMSAGIASIRQHTSAYVSIRQRACIGNMSAGIELYMRACIANSSLVVVLKY